MKSDNNQKENYIKIEKQSNKLNYLMSLLEKAQAGEQISGDIETEIIEHELHDLLSILQTGTTRFWIETINERIHIEEEKLNEILKLMQN